MASEMALLSPLNPTITSEHIMTNIRSVQHLNS
jgi:hypothetical protein